MKLVLGKESALALWMALRATDPKGGANLRAHAHLTRELRNAGDENEVTHTVTWEDGATIDTQNEKRKFDALSYAEEIVAECIKGGSKLKEGVLAGLSEGFDELSETFKHAAEAPDDAANGKA